MVEPSPSAASHLRRLAPAGAALLAHEDASQVAHMHQGSLTVFDGPPPSGREFRGHVASRLPLLPHYRQRVIDSPLPGGRRLWVDDGTFQLDYHIRHVALPSPGTESQLQTLVSRVVSQRLDRSKPLWELWLVEGLMANRWAVISKVHQALVGDVDLVSRLVDSTPASDIEHGHSWARTDTEHDRWQARRTPRRLLLAGRGLLDVARDAAGLGRAAATLAVRPDRVVALAAGGALGLTRRLFDTAPPSPLNGAAGPHRRLAVARTLLSDHREVKKALGGRVNDVVVSVVASAVRAWMLAHAYPLPPQGLRALVPAGGLDTEGVFALLPVQIDDPVERFAIARRTLAGSDAQRLPAPARAHNLLVTHVAGPSLPVYLMGRRLREFATLPPLGVGHRLAVAVTSYDGEVSYALLADRDALPDLGELARGIEQGLAELVAAARTIEGTVTPLRAS